MHCVGVHLLASSFFVSFFFSPSPLHLQNLSLVIIRSVWFWTVLYSFWTVYFSTIVLFLLCFSGFRTVRTVFSRYSFYIYTLFLLFLSSITIFPAYYYRIKCPKCMVLAVSPCCRGFAEF